MVFGMAESVPRLWQHLLNRSTPARRRQFDAAARRVVVAWIAGVLLVSFAVHPVFASWSTKQGEIRDAIADVIDPEAVIVTNFMATRKFLPELKLKYLAVNRAVINVETANSLVGR